MTDERKAWLAEAERLVNAYSNAERAHASAVYCGGSSAIIAGRQRNVFEVHAALMEHLARASLPQPAAAQGEPVDLSAIPGEVLGHDYCDWPSDLHTFSERKAYQRGVAHARAVAASLPPAVRLSDDAIKALARKHGAHHAGDSRGLILWEHEGDAGGLLAFARAVSCPPLRPRECRTPQPHRSALSRTTTNTTS